MADLAGAKVLGPSSTAVAAKAFARPWSGASTDSPNSETTPTSASTPSANSFFQTKDLVSLSETLKALMGSPPATSSAASDASASDSPTESSTGSDLSRIALSGLTTALRNLLRSGATTSNTSSGGSTSSPLGGLLGLQSNNSSLSRLFQRVEKMMQSLEKRDDEALQKLEILLKTLGELNGDTDSESFAESFEQTVQQIVTARESMASIVIAQSSSLGDMTQQAVVQQTRQPVVERVTYSLEIEVSQSSQLEATVAELNEQGFSVQQLRVEQSQLLKLKIEFSALVQRPLQSEPLILDLNGDGVRPTGIDGGVAFDIDADGVVDQTAFVGDGDGALALDRNGNGAIDDGGELFGDQHGAAGGFEELAKFDDNADGVIDARDRVWKSLGVIRDANADGRLDPSEFMTLDTAGVGSISLLNKLLWEDDAQGNSFAERGSFAFADGRQGQAVDVWFGYRPGISVLA